MRNVLGIITQILTLLPGEFTTDTIEYSVNQRKFLNNLVSKFFISSPNTVSLAFGRDAQMILGIVWQIFDDLETIMNP